MTTLAVCVRIACADGTVIGFTDHDRDITYGATLYASRAGHTPTALATTSDLSVDNLDITGLLDAAGVNEADVAAGTFDHAEVRVFALNYAAPAQGEIKLRRGWLGEVKIEQGRYTSEVRGLTQALQQTIGELYSPDCRADLGDSRCTVDLEAFTVTGTVTAVTDRRTFTDSARAEAEHWFRYGLLTWTGGDNAGRAMEVKAFAAGVFTLFLPMPQAVQAGDTYSVYAGCDKFLTSCRDKFDNVVNFRGEPYVPGIHAIREYVIPPAG